MPALIHLLSAAVASAIVRVLTWKKAGIPRTMRSWAVGVAVGGGADMAATQMLLHHDAAFAPSEMLAPFLAAFITAIGTNRRAHRLAELDQS